MTRNARVVPAGIGLTAVLGSVLVATAACGGGASSSASPAQAGGATSTPTAAPTAGGSGGSQGGYGYGGLGGGAQLQKIEQCLQAAGIAVPTLRPSRSPGATPYPSDRSFSPQPGQTAYPRRNGTGGFGTLFSSPQARQALAACGITLPSRAPRPSGAPTASSNA